MRRLRIRTGAPALFGAMLAVALLVFFPMRLALGWAGAAEQGLVARAVTGSIWGATLSEAKFGDLGLGDVAARLSPLPLLVGRATLAIEGPGGQGAPPLSGRAFVSRHAAGIEAFTGRLVTGTAFQPLPVTALDLDGVTARFEDEACVTAEGRVRATLAGDVAGVVLPPTIEGVARCDAGALLLPLASAAGTEAVAFRIFADGRYRADLAVRPTDPVVVARLAASGFTLGPAGYALSVEGRF